MRMQDRSPASKDHERWLRRQAIQIVAQLPDDEEEALRILTHARELVAQFVGDGVGKWETRALRLVSSFEQKEG